MTEEKRPYRPCEPAVSLVCRCGAEFTRPAWRVRQAAKQGATLHCSYACSHDARRTRTPESKAEYHRAYREKNRESIREKQNAARMGDKRDHILARDKAIYRRNIEINRQRAREYAAEHREEASARRKAWPEKNPERNRFHMVRSNIAQSVEILPREVPDELVEAKMEQLNIQRWLREQSAQGMPPAGPRREGGSDALASASPVAESHAPDHAHNNARASDKER